LPENPSERIKQQILNIIQTIEDDSYKAIVMDEFASYTLEPIEDM
jgi:hypothetical protein